MANVEQLKELHQGSVAWNKWRRETHNDEIDLIGANLGGAKLSKADLGEARLIGANLSGSDLTEARLIGANLDGANLSGANLSKARLGWARLIRSDLSEADLSGARLSEADLSGARLIGARLIGAKLSGADLSEARLSEADLSGARLGEAKLSKADLSKADLSEADLGWAMLIGANLSGANLDGAGLIGVNLSGANLDGASLIGVNLSGANLSGANLIGANLSGARLIRANLIGANLIEAVLIETNLERAILTGCRVYGVSAWGLKISDAKQNDLVITRSDQPIITVDNLEVAQFIYLLLHNEKIRDVINTVANKAVLILGRFTPERKAVLDALRTELRQRGYLPILFDFEKPNTRDFTETIKILAGMSLFVIADISNPKSSPLELQATVPDYMVPFVPIIQEGEEPFSMFRDLHIKYKKWVLEPLEYDSLDNLIYVFNEAIINPALEVHNQLLAEKAAELPHRHVRDYK